MHRVPIKSRIFMIKGNSTFRFQKSRTHAIFELTDILPSSCPKNIVLFSFAAHNMTWLATDSHSSKKLGCRDSSIDLRMVNAIADTFRISAESINLAGTWLHFSYTLEYSTTSASLRCRLHFQLRPDEQKTLIHFDTTGVSDVGSLDTSQHSLLLHL
jgi:hypothetical protein